MPTVQATSTQSLPEVHHRQWIPRLLPNLRDQPFVQFPEQCYECSVAHVVHIADLFTRKPEVTVCRMASNVDNDLVKKLVVYELEFICLLTLHAIHPTLGTSPCVLTVTHT